MSTETRVHPNAVATRSQVALSHVASSASTAHPVPRSIPPAVSKAQLYYWTRQWQHDELESLAELDRGEGRVFESAREAIHWLLSDD